MFILFFILIFLLFYFVEKFKQAGYDLGAGLAELIDNSLQASRLSKKKQIRVKFKPNTSVLKIDDDGCGMTLPQLENWYLFFISFFFYFYVSFSFHFFFLFELFVLFIHLFRFEF
jgi:hypothetical protein